MLFVWYNVYKVRGMTLLLSSAVMDPGIGGRGEDPSPFVLPCHKVAHLNAVRSLGEHCKLTLQAWAEPGHQMLFYAFRVEKSLLVATICQT